MVPMKSSSTMKPRPPVGSQPVSVVVSVLACANSFGSPSMGSESSEVALRIELSDPALERSAMIWSSLTSVASVVDLRVPRSIPVMTGDLLFASGCFGSVGVSSVAAWCKKPSGEVGSASLGRMMVATDEIDVTVLFPPVAVGTCTVKPTAEASVVYVVVV